MKYVFEMQRHWLHFSPSR